MQLNYINVGFSLNKYFTLLLGFSLRYLGVSISILAFSLILDTINKPQIQPSSVAGRLYRSQTPSCILLDVGVHNWNDATLGATQDKRSQPTLTG